MGVFDIMQICKRVLFLTVLIWIVPTIIFAGDHDSVEKLFVEGKRSYDSGDIEKALSVWKSISKDDLYGPVVYLLAASGYVSARKYSMAETSVKEFLKVHPSTPYKEMAISILIESQVEQGKKDGAKTIQNELGKAADFEKAALLYKLARLEIKTGNYSLAEKYLRKLVVEYSASLEGVRASEHLSVLVASKKIPGFKLTEPEEKTRANKLFLAGKFDLAIESYERLLKMKPDDKNTKFKLARCLYKNRNNQEAIKLLQNFLNSKLTVEEQTEANYLLSLIYWRLDKDREFEASCKKVLEKGSPKFQRRVTANLAAHNFEKGNLAKAQDFYNKLLSETDDSIVRADIKWKLAWIKYRNRDFTQAANLFSESRKLSTNGKLVDPSKYWQARSLFQAGSHEAADQLYRQLVSSRKNEYYALEAAKALGINETHMRSASLEKSSFPDTKLTPTQTNVKEVKAAIALLEKDLPELALANLRALPKNVRDSPSIALLTARAAHNSGFYGMAHDVLFSQFGSLVDEPPDSSPAEFINMAYPKAHYPHTVRQAAAHSVDPYVVWSIMRQESKYDSAAISPAGAIGLMQVTPATALKLPGSRPKTNSSLISELLEPKRNISTGVEILALNLKSFQGNLVSAIAAYNADPMKVRDWLKRNGKMKQDEFIENIPFLETRLYVKKVLANLAVYRKIHARRDMAERW